MKIVAGAIGLLMLSVFLLPRSFAGTHDVLCVDHQGGLSPCDAVIEDLRLHIIYRDAKDQDLNLVIPAWNILSMTKLEATKWNNSRDKMQIDYSSDAKDKDAPQKTLLLDANKVEGMRIRMQLEAATRKKFSVPNTPNP